MDASNIAVSIPRLAGESLDAAIERAKVLGFSAITFSGAPADDISSLSFLWEDLDAAQRSRMLSVRNQFKRAVIHAPYIDLSLVSGNPYIERESMRQILSSVHAAGALNLETVTIHTGQRHHSTPPDESLRRLVANLRTLGNAAVDAGTRICVENWRYPADPDEHDALLMAVDHPAVGATVDLGHIAYWYKRDGVSSLAGKTAYDEYNSRLLGLIERLGKRIFHIHAHDVHPETISDHHPCGTGIIDYESVIGKLEQIGFDGLLLLEVRPNGADYASVVISSRDRLLQAMRAPVMA